MQPELVQRHAPWPVAAAIVQSDKLATAQEAQSPSTDSAREASRTRCKAQEPQSQQMYGPCRKRAVALTSRCKARNESAEQRRQGKRLHRQCRRALLCRHLQLVWIHRRWRRHGREARNPCVQDLCGHEGVRLHSSASHLGRHKSQLAPFARYVTRYVVRAGDKRTTKASRTTLGRSDGPTHRSASSNAWARRRPSIAPQNEGC
jgi:hypothetical protein